MIINGPWLIVGSVGLVTFINPKNPEIIYIICSDPPTRVACVGSMGGVRRVERGAYIVDEMRDCPPNTEKTPPPP